MKQYTDKDQTSKLIELGFPKPKSTDVMEDYKHPEYVDEDGTPWSHVESYSVGELIEFLEHRIYRIENDMQWLVDGARVYGADEELINALFDACVTLKEEGMI